MLLVQENDNIPKSLDICSKVEQELQKECFVGVFMEEINRENLSIHGLAERTTWNDEYAQRVEDICLSYNAEKASACWQTISSVYGLISGNEVQLRSHCHRAPNSSDQKKCFMYGAGFMAFLKARNDEDLSNLPSYCDEFSNRGEYQECVFFIVDTVINSSVNFTDKLTSFCQKIMVDSKEYCFKTILKSLGKYLTNEKVENYCDYNLALEINCGKVSSYLDETNIKPTLPILSQ